MGGMGLVVCGRGRGCLSWADRRPDRPRLVCGWREKIFPLWLLFAVPPLRSVLSDAVPGTAWLRFFVRASRSLYWILWLMFFFSFHCR